MKTSIIDEVEELYQIISFSKFRETPGVSFDILPLECFKGLGSIDRVIHKNDAVSPGSVDDIERPWYMHPHQDDNLMVMHGKRVVDIYTRKHGKIETFTVTPERIKKNGKLIYEGGAMLVWPRSVFHRIKSDSEGSASINFAVHYDGFNIKTNFNIYNLDTDTGKFTVIRKGEADQN
ncbi:hypothetical protein KAJ27_00015 [bacterium]|nr:hypothetical protein [bacterium]